jgi:hypothetical protein
MIGGLSRSMPASLKSARSMFLGDTANWKILPRVAWGLRSLSRPRYGFVERLRACTKERDMRSTVGRTMGEGIVPFHSRELRDPRQAATRSQ